MCLRYHVDSYSDFRFIFWDIYHKLSCVIAIAKGISTSCYLEFNRGINHFVTFGPQYAHYVGRFCTVSQMAIRSLFGGTSYKLSWEVAREKHIFTSRHIEQHRGVLHFPTSGQQFVSYLGNTCSVFPSVFRFPFQEISRTLSWVIRIAKHISTSCYFEFHQGTFHLLNSWSQPVQYLGISHTDSQLNIRPSFWDIICTISLQLSQKGTST